MRVSQIPLRNAMEGHLRHSCMWLLQLLWLVRLLWLLLSLQLGLLLRLLVLSLSVWNHLSIFVCM